jgi:hypothetical protein
MPRAKQNSRRPNCKGPGPSTADFEAAVAAVFEDHPDADFMMPDFLEGMAHKKLKAKATRLQVARAIQQMVKREQLWPFVVAGAQFEDGTDAFVFRRNPNCALGNVIPFPG